jgi:hypothetical protein
MMMGVVLEVLEVLVVDYGTTTQRKGMAGELETTECNESTRDLASVIRLGECVFQWFSFSWPRPAEI